MYLHKKWFGEWEEFNAVQLGVKHNNWAFKFKSFFLKNYRLFSKSKKVWKKLHFHPKTICASTFMFPGSFFYVRLFNFYMIAVLPHNFLSGFLHLCYIRWMFYTVIWFWQVSVFWLHNVPFCCYVMICFT